MVDLEVPYCARDAAEYTPTAAQRAGGFTDAPPTPQIARQIQATPARAQPAPRRHSSPSPSPEHYGDIMLHHDTDF